MSRNNETAPFTIGDQLRLRITASAIIALGATAAIAGGAYFGLREDVQRSKLDIAELKADARQQREILIRIDENVKALKEADTRTR